MGFVFAKWDHVWGESLKLTIVRNSILSDVPEACRIVYEHCRRTYLEDMDELKKLIMSRGKTEILKIFDIEQEENENKNELLKKIPKTANSNNKQFIDK